MRRAAEALEEVVKELGMEGALRLARIRAHWSRHPGPPVARHAWPVRLNDSTLIIAVDSPVWLQELGFLKTELLGLLTPLGVTELNLLLGAVPRPAARSASQGHWVNENVDDASRDFIKDTVSDLKDSALAEQVASAMRNWVRHQPRLT